MKTKVLVMAIGITLGLLAVYKGVEWWKERAAKEAQELQAREEIRTAVAELASRHKAATDWEVRLGQGKKDRLPPVLTIELEQVWLDGPILFFGSITDISSVGTETYEVVVEQGSFGADHVFAPDLRLSLRASKTTIDSFLEKHRDLFDQAIVSKSQDGVAIVAKIRNITSRDERGMDGDRFQIKTGHGELLGVVYTSDVYFRKQPVTSYQPDD